MNNGNLPRGAVSLDVDGDVHILRFSVNALCALEERLGQPIVKLADELSDPERMTMPRLRSFAWAALIDQHPEITETEVGRIMSDAGLSAFMTKLQEAFALQFPPADERAGAPSGNGVAAPTH